MIGLRYTRNRAKTRTLGIFVALFFASATHFATTQNIDINSFNAPKDRDEALFLINLLENYAWDTWPGADASLFTLGQWAKNQRDELPRFQAQAIARNQPQAVVELYANALLLVDATEAYCKATPLQKQKIREETEGKRQDFIDDTIENTWEVIFAKVFGDAESLNKQREKTTKDLTKSAQDAVQAVNSEEERFESWRKTQLENLNVLRISIEKQAIKSISVLAIQRNWKPGETRFDATPILTGENKVAARVRDPFVASTFFSGRASTLTAFDAMADAIFMYERATYVPEDAIYKPIQLRYLGYALRLAADAAARTQNYSSKPTFPSVAALKLSNRYIEQVSDNHPPEAMHVSNMARVAALNGKIELALEYMKSCENKPYCKNDKYFHLRYARMLSVANQRVESLEKFQKYVSMGGKEFSDVRADEDFKNLRSQIALNQVFNGVDLKILIGE